jgi:hypothetical protein
MGVAFQDDGIISNVNGMTAGDYATAKLKLFAAGPTITNATTLGALTEATFGGYASVTLSGFPAATASGHVATSTANPVTFSRTSGSQNIGGWFITNAAGTKLLAAGNDPNDPVSINSTVNTYQVTPTLGNAS